MNENAAKQESGSLEHKRQGFQQKPLRIYVISIFLITLPLISYLKALYVIGADWQSPREWIEHANSIPSTSWALVAITMLSGMAMLIVRKSALIFSTVGLLGIFTFNLIAMNKLMLLSLIVPVALLVTSFRKVYFNAELRWWEQLPRHLLDQAYVRVLLGLQPKQLAVVNMSLSGALIDTKYKSRVPDIGEKLILDINKDLHISATVVRLDGCRFGIKFDPMSKEQRRNIKSYIDSQAKSKLAR